MGAARTYFIIWPFHYIKGFHSPDMQNWVKKQKHYSWDIRVELLNKAIEDNGNSKIKILKTSKKWYIESEKFFNPDDRYSYFWTGTWYVIRKLQYIINTKQKNGGG